MTKYQDLYRKFAEKGREWDFHWLVPFPPSFEPFRLVGTLEEKRGYYKSAVEKVYGEEWDKWSTWIDYQNYK